MIFKQQFDRGFHEFVTELKTSDGEKSDPMVMLLNLL